MRSPAEVVNRSRRGSPGSPAGEGRRTLASVTRYFNTTGPCDPALHYTVPSEQRLPDARRLAERGLYFVLHAPRQTGKTTLLRTLAKALTEEGRFAALHFSCEVGEALQADISGAERAIYRSLQFSARDQLPDTLQPPVLADADAGTLLLEHLGAWARACPRPLVLFFDEIDALRGQSLIAVLRQLRAGFVQRPHAFPHSVALCGLRDVRDYKAASGGDASRLGTSSPFNIKVRSLRLGSFGPGEVRSLLAQHAQDTGQELAPGALEHLLELSGGQPWLVNSLALEVVEELQVPPSEAITAAHLDEAKERLILARQTHLDSLVARLHEPRVRRVLGPMLAGTQLSGDHYDEDIAFVRDLGLIAPKPPLRVANPIYREVMVRVLGGRAEDAIDVEPRSFVRPDGTLDGARVLEEFAVWWREHGEALTQGASYHEVAPQLVLMAWLQRIVNGGGYIDREYGAGRGRIDLLVRWPWRGPDGARQVQRMALELKVWRDGRPDPLDKGLEQLDGYLQRLSLDEGVLVLFDRRSDAAPIPDRTRFDVAETATGRAVTVLRA